MPANVGSYLDSPFHRFPDREDLSQLPLDRLVGIEGVANEQLLRRYPNLAG